MKRLMDVVVATMLLVLLSPILAVVAIATGATMGLPFLFRQTRPGLGGAPFTLVKFRTMTAPASGALSDERRLTAVGSFLRRWSLDELPELWNVLRGDMSLVGPRPLLMEYLGRYNARQARRHEVKPGITGWAQVNGRNSLTWEEKFDLDVWYVDHQSFWLDLKILARTAGQVLTRRGISHAGSATMPEFQGQAGDGPQSGIGA
jgi:sugar transferase EpsL